MSFFWRGVLSVYPILRCCVLSEVNSGADTYFWKDRWLNGRAPMYVWHEQYRECGQQDASFKDLAHLLEGHPFCEDADLVQIRDRWRNSGNDVKDIKRWALNGTGAFSVKSLYNFLIDGGVRCEIAKFFWKSKCPKKINIFNWLVWRNKILTMDNLELRRCNKLPTATCVMCHADTESVDHLFLQCPVARDVWGYFCRLLGVPEPPISMTGVWREWRGSVRPNSRVAVDLVVKALVWNIWIARNDRIFNDKILPATCILLCINRMLLSWFDALADGAKAKLEDTMAIVRGSLEFLESRSQRDRGDCTAEEAPYRSTE
ncbi:uncharacterized protein LOC120253386 [Dioscorea cayenensis subsp. rotundata]|uniref:Uncharacterized protein LOC120253386 n=1 Tax=Dioscorea cayennensis subsp. rotundata TaxID=55577 RepID=A0AB40AS81_DIOCR|nr:uncharacterized protein LOC120253386 [Dioscorea cayenensis subsp. rotundata]